MPNRLADESSPYLRQHADNPVDWVPWSEQAFEEARERDVPVFISVGYSSCHWCHVMAHESFEDEATAAYLNERFVSIKVDREERPDVDAVYMDAVQAMTGHGGWPMTVFADHDGRPFFGGTYFPKEGRPGLPSFMQVLESLHDAWETRRDEVLESSTSISEHLARANAATLADAPDLTVSDAAARVLVGAAWDRRLGGFGRAPKFPQAMTISFLMAHHQRTGEKEALQAAAMALDAMARGGIHDQLAGGFHRYSTDAQWLAPHFEKMLYDNALLAPAYAEAYRLVGDPRFARTARMTCDYLLRDLRHPDGGFFAATDADSEGVEGKYFTWGYDEFRGAVSAQGHDADRFTEFFGVQKHGNWEHTNILHEPLDRIRFCEQRGIDVDKFEQELAAVRQVLLAVRAPRIEPGLDDKVLTSWNALAIRGLARTGALLGEERYVAAAVETAAFLRDHLVVDGRLHHTWKDGVATVPAFLEDVAYLASACLELYAATGDDGWFTWAVELATDARERFRDHEAGGFFQTADDAETLYARPKDSWDNATPSGNSVMAEVGAKLAAYTGDHGWREVAEEVLRLFQHQVERGATGYGWLLQVVEFLRQGPREVAIVGGDAAQREALVRAYWERPRPGTVLAVSAAAEVDAGAAVPLLAHRREVDGVAAAYVCRDFVCERPVTLPDELVASLG